MKRCRFDQIKDGEYLSMISYVKVQKVEADKIKVTNIKQKNEFYVQGRALVEEEFSSASQHDPAAEKKMTATELAERFIHCGDSVFTVVFTKADGTERTLIGHFLHSEPLLGRSYVLDLEVNERRLVDHRTIRSLVTQNVRYVLK